MGRKRHRGKPFDEDGAWAAGGTVDAALLERLLAEPFFDAAAAEEHRARAFNLAWLDAATCAGDGAERRAGDAAPIHRAHRSCARSIATGAATDEIFLCGGGARNGALLRASRALAAAPARRRRRDDTGRAVRSCRSAGVRLARDEVRAAASR